VVAQFVSQILARAGAASRGSAVVACGGRGEPETATLLDAAGQLFVAGAPIADQAAPAPARAAELVVFSAKSPEALRAFAGRLRDHVERHPEQSLVDVSAT